MRTGCVYTLTTPQGTPFYVGRTSRCVSTRVREHLRRARRGEGGPMHELLRSAGRCGFWVLESGIAVDAICAAEQRWEGVLREAGFELLNSDQAGKGCIVQTARKRKAISRAVAKAPRDRLGRYVPVLEPISGAAPSDGELFMAGLPIPDCDL